MRHLASVACVWLALIGVSACGGPDLSAEVAEFAAHRLDEAHFACSCPEDLNYDGSAECVDALGEVDDDEQACMADALSAEGDAGKAYIDCVNVTWAAHRDCLMANPGCEPGWYDSCAADRTAAEMACTQVEQSTQTELSLCDLN